MPINAVCFSKPGGPEVLTKQQLPDLRKPGKDEVVIRQTHIGFNDIDADYRRGTFKAPKTPFTPGIEAVGIVEARGDNVTLEIGKKVIYGMATNGAYCDRRIVNVSRLNLVPDHISSEHAAAIMTKGMIAHMLIHRVYKLNKNDVAIIHDVTGPCGYILCQWAKDIGAKVIGTVNMDAKERFAKKLGCDVVVNTSKDNLVEIVKDKTKGYGATIVYDSVGKDAFSASIKSLAPLGVYVSYAQSSGPIPGINILSLASKGIFMTRPTLHLYKNSVIEMALTMEEVYTKYKNRVIEPFISATLPLEQAAKAHAAYESGKMVGSVILTV